MRGLILAAVMYVSGSVFGVLSGSGTQANPYLIQSRADFDEFAENSSYWASGVCTKLMCDIDLAGTTYTQAVVASDVDDTEWGFQGTQFEGVFDGNGHTVYNLMINQPTKDYIGLFGYIDMGGQVKNMGVENVTLSGHHSVGGLVGCNGLSGTIISCYATGSVTGFFSSSSSGASYIGGLAGNNNGTITSSYATGLVTASSFVGGLVGFNHFSGTITSSYATGSVSGFWDVGGLVGNNDIGAITSSYATGNVSGSYNVGGLVGNNYSGTITSSYATGNVSGSWSVGGLVGDNLGTIASCFWDKQASGITDGVGSEETDPAGVTGKTTAEMMTLSTFTEAGWDFMGEDANGLNDYWQMEEGTYPHHASPVWTLTGEGIFNNPYIIATAVDLGKVWRRPSACYCLGGNLDLSGMSWSSTVIPSFVGSLDGQGFVISNLTINLPGGDHIGLFGYVCSTGQIRDLGIENVTISGNTEVGGLAGSIYGTITSCYCTGNVSGSGDVGGLVGENCSGTITSCYATGVVCGSSGWVGGLVGANSGTITSCYATGVVCGSSPYVGGLAGYSVGQSACFWDTETSGQTIGVSYSSSTGAAGKTTAEMKTLSTFTSAGWDFLNVWGIGNGQTYPYLKTFNRINPADINYSGGVDLQDLAILAANWLKMN